ncbi:hypothetical protein [Psychrobacter sp.]|uniref:hypothetical protein n=1 Tax=Psychrobacter sp. TaxID=56811 RepID=UPI00264FB593|nr:hypothetical protein [Psychrobacter sp.]
MSKMVLPVLLLADSFATCDLSISSCRDNKGYKMTYDNEIEVDNDNTDQFAGFGKETTLELVESEDGRLLLRDAEQDDEALMTIDFSEKLKELLGSDTQAIGQHMIHAAIQVIMQKQMSQWHAHVYDKEPTHYS